MACLARSDLLSLPHLLSLLRFIIHDMRSMRRTKIPVPVRMMSTVLSSTSLHTPLRLGLFLCAAELVLPFLLNV